MSQKLAFTLPELLAAGGVAGAGLTGAGYATGSPMLAGLGGGVLGGLGGGTATLLGGHAIGGVAAGALGGGIAGAGAAYQATKNKDKHAMLDDIYNMGLDAAIDQFTKSAGIKRRIGKTYRRVIGKPSMRDRVENGVDAVRDRVSGPINSAKNLGSSAVNAVKKTWNDYSNKGEE
jgi:hypothetical protein